MYREESFPLISEFPLLFSNKYLEIKCGKHKSNR